MTMARDPVDQHREAMRNRYDDGGHSKGNVDVGYELLYFVALIAHLIDAMYLNFAIQPSTVGIRAAIYMIVGVTAYFVLTKRGLMDLRTVIGVTLLLVFGVPLFQWAMTMIFGPVEAIGVISTLILFIPIWLLLLVAGGYTYTRWRFPITPVRLARWYFTFLIFFGLIYMVATSASIVEDTGLQTQGVNVQEGVTIATDFVWETLLLVEDQTVNFIFWTNQTISDIENETLGRYYQNEVDDAPEQLGVFLEGYGPVRSTQREDQPIIIDGLIEANAFRRAIDINITCIAQDQRNSSNVVQGELGDDKIKTVREFGRASFTCEFESGSLEPGRYEVQSSFEFDFDTMASMQYAFISSERARTILQSANPGGGFARRNVVAEEVGISESPRVSYSGGPAVMSFRGQDSLPVWIDINESTSSPLDVRLEGSNRMPGEIKRIQEIDLRLPEPIDLVNEGSQDQECRGIPFRVEPDRNVESYERYVFEDIGGWYFDERFDLICEVHIPREEERRDFLGTDGYKEFTVASVAEYTYVFEDSAFIEVEESLEERR